MNGGSVFLPGNRFEIYFPLRPAFRVVLLDNGEHKSKVLPWVVVSLVLVVFLLSSSVLI